MEKNDSPFKDYLPPISKVLLLPLTFRWAWSLTRSKESSSSFFSRSKSAWACLAMETCLVTSAFCKEERHLGLVSLRLTGYLPSRPNDHIQTVSA